MTTDRVMAFQIAVIGLLCAILTIKLSVDHPEWSPDGLVELHAALPHHLDKDISRSATP